MGPSDWERLISRAGMLTLAARAHTCNLFLRDIFRLRMHSRKLPSWAALRSSALTDGLTSRVVIFFGWMSFTPSVLFGTNLHPSLHYIRCPSHSHGC